MSNWQQALDNAINAARLGFGVFPLSRNKVPAIPSPHDRGHNCKGMAQCGSPGHGVGDATTVPADVRFLFEQAPRAAGYGVACDGRLVGLDLDRKNGVDGIATLNQLAERYGFTIPRTLTVCTPSGGLHLWLTVPEGTVVPNSVGRLGPGIDVRSTRGYLVGPGSMGKAGEYRFHPSLGYTEPLPCPPELLKLMLPPPAPARVQPALLRTRDAALDGLLRVLLGAQEGDRNSKLYWASCKAWAHVADGHLNASDAERALVGAAVSLGLTEAEAQRTVASARRTAGATR
ncbi:bifunctional DNA primase/polymerase [Actinacidiphila sp. ITFR-21]|uniref:bifunctional DNA primase/polymerase n=1 Tax=Actinacidiphila sp. ITFR-21 TaxID=3075199 RepID=UPI002889637D|nr:bifunctional DNA primase/polymerase [Streptomyces sp. ITFR-21]WNI15221.1 bifunctional DNA primase/polymerase [Streptomyces sp. ITFR-21]